MERLGAVPPRLAKVRKDRDEDHDDGRVVEHAADQQHREHGQGERNPGPPAGGAEQRAGAVVERPGLRQPLPDDDQPEKGEQRRTGEAGQQVGRPQLVPPVGAGFGEDVERQQQQADHRQRHQFHRHPGGGIEHQRHRNGPKCQDRPDIALDHFLRSVLPFRWGSAMPPGTG